jgi:serine/threonine protein kinase/tetratricopeptide (TPR) repeat protein
MSSQRDIAELFEAALSLQSAERDAFLEDACKGRPEIKHLVENLLAEDARVGSFILHRLSDFGDKQMLLDAINSKVGHLVFDNKTTPVLAPRRRFQPGDILIDRFAIVRYISGGGMGEVYEAEDRFLQNAHVALKTILSQIANDPAMQNRFEKEVLLAQKVTHENLCPIYAIFHCEQPLPAFSFLTMKLLPGMNLAERLQRHAPIPQEEAMQILRQMIAGLAALHAVGIIHRDVKPNNIMLDGSGQDLRLCITDFGLARAYAIDSTNLSKGAVMGTPAYMAPELFFGRPPSQASDIFAFGVVLHEVFTGEKPSVTPGGFSAAPSNRLKFASVPSYCKHLVRDCLSDDPKIRCQAFVEAQHRLHVQQGRDPPGGFWTRRRFASAGTKLLHNIKFRIATLGVAAVLGLIVAIQGWNGRGWRDRFLPRATEPQIRALAVLPFENLSGDPGQDYFAEGMTDELITMLAKNSNLRTISRTSAMQYKGVHRPVRDIARELGVDGILEGSVARTGTKVHVTMQLIHAPSDTHLWAESYDRDVGNAVSLPREATQTIVKHLKSAAAPMGPQRYVSPEAHDAYLHGLYYWFSMNSSKAGEYFRKAVELQPDYALGWSGLAQFYGGSTMRLEARPADVLPQWELSTVKAMELDDLLPEAHNGMGAFYLFYKWNWAGADTEFKRAVELNPNYAEAYHMRSYALVALNRMDEALGAQSRATELDPFARPWAMGSMLIRMRQFHAALNDTLMRLEAHPETSSLHGLLSDVYWYNGMEKEAAQELEKGALIDGDKVSAAAVRRAFAQGGYKAVLEWQVSELTKSAAKNYVSPISFAYIYGRLGLRERTLHYLDEAYKEHSPRLVFIQTVPDFDFLHSDERYRVLVRRIGLPPAF